MHPKNLPDASESDESSPGVISRDLEALLEEMERRPTPERLLDLASQLQHALTARQRKDDDCE